MEFFKWAGDLSKLKCAFFNEALWAIFYPIDPTKPYFLALSKAS